MIPTRLRLAFLAPTLLLATSLPASAEGARIVDAPGLPSFQSLQAAVDAAVDGDTIVVAGGSYAAFSLVGKGVSLVGVPGQTVHVEGPVELEDLQASQRILLSGLIIEGPDGGDGLDAGLIVTNCAGHVRLEGCTVRGGEGGSGDFVYGAGSPGVVLQNSPQVAFAHCTLAGGDGGTGGSQCFDCVGGNGAFGVRVNLSTPVFYQCAVTGGSGGDNGGGGGDGATALRQLNGRMFAAGSTFVGGGGGNGLDFLPTFGGDGGDGLFLDGGASAELLDVGTFGGAAGQDLIFPRNDGSPGVPIGGNGSSTLVPGVARDFLTFRMVFDESTLQVSIQGEPGDEVWLKTSPDPAFRLGTPAAGAHLVANAHLSLTPHGVIPASGTLLLQIQAPQLAAADRLIYLQGFGKSAGGTAFLGSPMHAMVLDLDAGPDCNGNLTSDLADAILGTSADCGPNLVPDECDPDCNGNGTPDDCDLAAGSALDCNANGTPDSCDIAGGTSLDCNSNGIPDSCDLASGASMDANSNGVPDECDPNMVWWVDASAAPGGDGSAGAPFQTILEAMQSAISGDEIVVRDGTYTGAGNRDVDFGFRSVNLHSENGPTSCVIDLEDMGRAFIISGNQGSSTIVEGFTILDGFAGSGGGMSVGNASPIVRNCVFESCTTTGQGGALNMGGSGGLIEDCTFTNNTTSGFNPSFHLGGALYVSGLSGGATELRVRRCTFEGNTAVDGGAMHTSGQAPIRLSHCSFLGNSATRWGGALANRSLGTQGGSLSVDACLFAGNDAGEDGGALYARPFVLNYPTDMVVSGCTFTDNVALDEGGAMAVVNGSSTSLVNSVLWANSAPFGAQLALDESTNTTWGIPEVSVARCDVQGGQVGVNQIGGSLTWGAGNLDVDPQFADADGADDDPMTLADNDYRPLAGSPVNDSGDNALVSSDGTDIDDDLDSAEATPLDLDLASRFVDDLLAPDVGAGTGPLVDMGCFERP